MTDPEPDDAWVDEEATILAAVENADQDIYSESEDGIRLYFKRLHNGWRVNRAGRLVPPKNLNITPEDPRG